MNSQGRVKHTVLQTTRQHLNACTLMPLSSLRFLLALHLLLHSHFIGVRTALAGNTKSVLVPKPGLVCHGYPGCRSANDLLICLCRCSAVPRDSGSVGGPHNRRCFIRSIYHPLHKDFELVVSSASHGAGFPQECTMRPRLLHCQCVCTTWYHRYGRSETDHNQ